MRIFYGEKSCLLRFAVKLPETTEKRYVMAEELQGILDRINADGIAKADAQRKEIISKAEAEAAKIIADAKAEAAEMKKQAESEIEAGRKRAENALIQAARDIKISLKGELEKRINNAVAGASAAALAPEFMAELIREAAQKFMASPDDELTVECAVKDVDSLDNALKAALADSLAKNPEILGNANIRGGVELTFQNGAFCIDFTTDAVNDLFAAYAGKLVEKIIREK